MSVKSESKNTIQFPFLWTALTLTFYIALLLIFCKFLPESGDDTVLMSILTGAMGNPSAEIIFSNILYGKFLHFLFVTFPGVNWYAVIQLILALAAVYAAGVMILKSYNPILGFPLQFLFYIAVGFDIFVRINFTKTAGIICAAGFALVLFHSNWRKMSKNSLPQVFSVLIGVLFVFVGSLIRFDSFLAVTAIFSGYLLWCLIKEYRSKNTRAVIIAVAAAVVVFGVALGAKAYNSNYYASSPEWTAYLNFNSARSKVRDYPVAPYEGHEKEYEEIGMTANDYANLLTFNINDPDFYTKERLELVASVGDLDFQEKVAQYKEKNTESKESSEASSESKTSSEKKDDSKQEESKAESEKQGNTNAVSNGGLLRKVKDFVKLLLGYLRYPWIYCFLALFFAGSGKQRWIGAGSALVLVGVFSLYLFLNGRFGMIRLHFLLWIAAIMVLISSLETPEKNQIFEILNKRNRIENTEAGESKNADDTVKKDDDSIDEAVSEDIKEQEDNSVEKKAVRKTKNHWQPVVMVLLSILMGAATVWRAVPDYVANAQTPVNTDVKLLYQYFNKHKDLNFFIEARTSYLGEQLYYVDYYDPATTENVYMLGGWYTGSKTLNEYLASEDLESPMSHLADDNAYFVTKSDPEIQQKYIEEHFGIKTKPKEVTSFGPYKIYKFEKVKD